MKARSTKPVRCAIYTRVSTDQGLEQDFNSLDAQHDACKPISAAKRMPAGRCCGPNTTTAVSPAATPTGPRCSGCCRRSGPARST